MCQVFQTPGGSFAENMGADVGNKSVSTHVSSIADAGTFENLLVFLILDAEVVCVG